MSTRNIKDAKDLSSGELIYFKGHAKATYMSDGTTVEDAINNIEAGGVSNDYWECDNNSLTTTYDVDLPGLITAQHASFRDYIQTPKIIGSDCSLIYNANSIVLNDNNDEDVLTITHTGDGTKFLSDDGSYKSVSEVSGGSEKELIEIESPLVDLSDMLPNVIYYRTTNISGIIITSFAVSNSFIDEYILVGKYASGSSIEDQIPMSITLPANVTWANGVIPEINEEDEFELSITRRDTFYKAVLTTFKTVE